MPTNSITVNIDPNVLATLTGFTLCVGKVLVDSTGEVSNVVMTTFSKLGPQILINWTDVYQICATSIPYQEGTTISTGGVLPQPIKLGQSYVIKDWFDPPEVIDDPEAPANGFSFKNSIVCSAVLSQQDPNTQMFVPIYISPVPLIAGTDMLIPIDKVVLWFAQNVEVTTMLSVDMGTSQLVDCTNGPQTVTYQSPGVWVGP